MRYKISNYVHLIMSTVGVCQLEPEVFVLEASVKRGRCVSMQWRALGTPLA